MGGQLSFAEGFLHPRLGVNDKLDAIGAAIDWKRIDSLAALPKPAATGRPAYEAAVMVKALIIAALYDLSDPALEAALADRLSFRRFCGLGLDSATPDETTICRFRATAAASGLMQRVLDEVNRQLEAAGLILKKGSMLDATLVKAAHNPPPAKAGLGAAHPREPGASWTKKNGKAFFGYKVHIGMDKGSGLVRRIVSTGAKIYESEVADGLISWDEDAVYGDKAYPKKERRAALKNSGIKDRIAHRRHKSQAALRPWRERWNKLVARHRAPVEAVFSAGKRLYGLARARCHSLSRNAVRFTAFAIAYNLRRVSILRSALRSA